MGGGGKLIKLAPNNSDTPPTPIQCYPLRQAM